MDKIEEKNEKICKKEIKKSKIILNTNKIINVCSRCGGNHYDLSCIYY